MKVGKEGYFKVFGEKNKVFVERKGKKKSYNYVIILKYNK